MNKPSPKKVNTSDLDELTQWILKAPEYTEYEMQQKIQEFCQAKIRDSNESQAVKHAAELSTLDQEIMSLKAKTVKVLNGLLEKKDYFVNKVSDDGKLVEAVPVETIQSTIKELEK